jgi:hypothetical protein
LTSSGQAPSHGEIFDTVGGIYLKSRLEPYEQGKGGRELDLAIERSFDSIAVPPGLKVVIKNLEGVELYSGSGPYMALSNAYQHISRPQVSNYLRGKESQMPPWMSKYLASINYILPELTLHTGTYVEVNKIPNVPCNSY